MRVFCDEHALPRAAAELREQCAEYPMHRGASPRFAPNAVLGIQKSNVAADCSSLPGLGPVRVAATNLGGGSGVSAGPDHHARVDLRGDIFRCHLL